MVIRNYSTLTTGSMDSDFVYYTDTSIIGKVKTLISDVNILKGKGLYGTSATPPTGTYTDGTTYDQYE